MEKYINKSVLVAEIEKRKNLCEKIFLDLRTQENEDYYQGKFEAYKEMISFLDTLETKEEDLDYDPIHPQILRPTGNKFEGM